MRKSYIAAIVCFIVLSLSNVAFSKVVFISQSWGVIEVKDEMTDDIFYHLVYINDEIEFSIVGMKDAGEENTALLFNKKAGIIGGRINMRVDDEPVFQSEGEVTNGYQAIVLPSNGDIINQMKFGKTLLVEVNPALPQFTSRISKINLEGFVQAYYKFRGYVNQ